MQTFFFPIGHLKARISVQEKIRMYELASENGRIDGIIKYMVRRDNIEQEAKLKNY